MLKFALYDYIPGKLLHRATFEQIDTRRLILDFKDGRNYASIWAAKAMAYAMSHINMNGVVIACVPASNKWTHARRYKRFCSMLCSMVNAVNGYAHITVSGNRKKAHVTGVYELCTNFDDYVHIDNAFFRGKKVVVIDDVCTTCTTANAFISALESAGADVCMAMFLGKTRRYRNS